MYYLNSVIALSLFFVGITVPSAGQAPSSQEQAVAAVLKLGGKVEVRQESFAKPVIAVLLAATAIKDNDLDFLQSLPDLERLDLSNTKVTDLGMVRLKKLARLRSLTLQSASGVTDRGLESLKRLTNLEQLDLQGTGVTGEGFAHLAGLPNLRSVYLSGDRITDASLVQLGKLEGIEELLLAYTRVSDAGLARLSKLPNLRRLHVRSGRITDAGLAHVRIQKRLELLQIPSTPRVTDAGIADLQSARPSLKVMHFREKGDPRQLRQSLHRGSNKD